MCGKPHCSITVWNKIKDTNAHCLVHLYMAGWTSLGHVTVLTGHLCSGGSHARLKAWFQHFLCSCRQTSVVSHRSCVCERFIRKCRGAVPLLNHLASVLCYVIACPNWSCLIFSCRVEENPETGDSSVLTNYTWRLKLCLYLVLFTYEPLVTVLLLNLIKYNSVILLL